MKSPLAHAWLPLVVYPTGNCEWHRIRALVGKFTSGQGVSGLVHLKHGLQDDRKSLAL